MTDTRSGTDIGQDGAVAGEQHLLTALYRRFDELRAERVQLRDRYVRDSDGTPAGRVERDLSFSRHAEALLAMNAAEDRLCFGRLDWTDGSWMHIGRMGVFDADQHQLLMDWRAPSARPFYVATAMEPLDVRRRRHLRTRRRRVLAVSDEILTLRPGDHSRDDGPAGESALLEALNAPRTGQMTDIVATIQAEQDRIIRADRSTVLVVQGGPGTGKTAVALHRAAYLLYAYRDQLANRGVLVLGPNETFLNYISQVLPSLGENAVVLATTGTLFPGVAADLDESPEAAVLKGRPLMAEVVANAVLHRQSVSGHAATIAFRGLGLRLRPGLLRGAQRRAWRSRRPHNLARPLFVRHVVDALAQQAADRLGTGIDGQRLRDAPDLDLLRRDLYTNPDLVAALRGVWPQLTPQTLLNDLFDSPERLAWAAPKLTEAERKMLQRSPSERWSVADVPLLDEAAELLGSAPAERSTAHDRRAEQLQFADDVLVGLNNQDEESVLTMLTARMLADRRTDDTLLSSTAERAAADREWTYGHVIVDEAQELSAMAWRMVMRRCPVRSMTLVGDIAQTSDPAGTSSWGRVLRPYVRDRWQLAPLTVNYRTPAEIMAVAEPVLREIDPALTVPTSIREGHTRPWHCEVPAGELIDRVGAAVSGELARLDADGTAPDPDEPAEVRTLAVIAPRSLVRTLSAVAQGHPGRVSVLTPVQAKGLEFDGVLVVEPATILAEAVRGAGDLYVALTRATQRLGVLHTGALPAVLQTGALTTVPEACLE